jgi:hypothetical protein
LASAYKSVVMVKYTAVVSGRTCPRNVDRCCVRAYRGGGVAGLGADQVGVMKDPREFGSIETIRKREEMRVAERSPTADIRRQVQSSNVHSLAVSSLGPAGHALPQTG